MVRSSFYYQNYNYEIEVKIDTTPINYFLLNTSVSISTLFNTFLQIIKIFVFIIKRNERD